MMRTPDRLAAHHAEDWSAFEDLVERAQGGGVRLLSAADVKRLGQLYRSVAGDLAVARRDFPEDRVTTYLENLAARAHPVVFRGSRLCLSDGIGFLTESFPRAVRSILPEVGVATLALFVPVLVCAAWAILRPHDAEGYVPAVLMERIREVGRDVRDQGDGPWVVIPILDRPLEAYAIALNNIRVSLLAFLGGATLGLLTLHVLVTNGILLGLVTGFCVREQALVSLGAFVAAHGFVELSLIVLAGAAGLSIGRAWLDPGERPRLQAVTEQARLAMTVALGGAVWLVVAGLLEGLLSPSAVSPWIKLAVGVSSGALLWTFLLRAGRTLDAPA
jgi:uncharacterized membrane protein SpoIIM required for sporulation